MPGDDTKVTARAWGAFAAVSILWGVAYFRLIADAGPGRAAVITYVNPAVAVVLGVVVLGERLSLVAVVGLLLILAGSWLSTGGRVRLPRDLASRLGRGRPRPYG
jgi:drug/metabolite transporter (DMT)-like permease